MIKQLLELFHDEATREKIQRKLPLLFTIAQKESQRAGQTGMQVGSLRENILIAMLIWKFGEKNVKTDLPITESEVDVLVFGQPLSIKTITGYGGVKLIWTVDAKKAKEFVNSYMPACDMLLAQIVWQDENAEENATKPNGGLFLIPLEVQKKVFGTLGKKYFKLPKRGTNPRGVELSSKALRNLLSHEDTHKLDIVWKQENTNFNIYKRWVDYWQEN
ncbi:MAG: ThaI family type II restriction endonuclease [Ignavibacteriae bacterium]|nr:ThaI family type II restriction endonuclease [Ignavibacteriota bacterium]